MRNTLDFKNVGLQIPKQLGKEDATITLGLNGQIEDKPWKTVDILQLCFALLGFNNIT